MPRLPIVAESVSTSSISPTYASLRARIRRVPRVILKSYRMRALRGRDLPVRIRPWFILFTCLILVLLGLLGFTNVAKYVSSASWLLAFVPELTVHRGIPLNDKILHFICLGLATGVFYWCFETEEDARRIWFWRHAGLLTTFVLCFFFGAVMSEYVQSLLPYKTFQGGDIIANLLGCTCGLAISWNLERHWRRRREIARLYTPLNVLPEDVDDDLELSGEDVDALSGLPLYRQTSQAPSKSLTVPPGRRRMGDVWDSREELFTLGEEDEEAPHWENAPSAQKTSR